MSDNLSPEERRGISEVARAVQKNPNDPDWTATHLTLSTGNEAGGILGFLRGSARAMSALAQIANHFHRKHGVEAQVDADQISDALSGLQKRVNELNRDPNE